MNKRWYCLPDCIWAFIAIGSLVCSSPQSVSEEIDGFVTGIDTSTQFDVGSLHVVLSRQTNCATEAVDYRIALKKETPRGLIPQRGFVLEQHPSAASILSKGCDELNLKVGTPVRLLGEKGNSGAFRVTRVIALAAEEPGIEIPFPKALRYTNPKHYPGELQGGAIIEETPSVSPVSHGWSGGLWLDGYPMTIDPSANLSTAPLGTEITFDYSGVRSVQFQTHPKTSGASQAVQSNLFQANSCAIYSGRITSGRMAVVSLRVWPNATDSAEKRFVKATRLIVQAPNYRARTPGTIKSGSRHDKPVEIVPTQKLQDWVESLGEELVPPYQKSLTDTDPTKIHFRFYIVRGSALSLKNLLLRSGGHLQGLQSPAFDDTVQAMPDGLVVVSDSALSRLQNKAQLAAILSYAVTAILQKQAYMTSYALQSADPYVNQPHFDFAVLQYEQTLRIGIRQMYLAGFDIREAPFAWAAAEGKSTSNPMPSFDDVPWYAQYAFGYLSQFYSDVDYSKLKRGEKEYAQFLDELRQADPEAFAGKK